MHSEREILGCIYMREILGCICIDRLAELIKMRIGSASLKRIILRGDPAYGTSKIVDRCLQKRYLFFKGARSSSARKYAKRIKEWMKIIDDEKEEVYAGELRAKLHGSRYRTRIGA